MLLIFFFHHRYSGITLEVTLWLWLTVLCVTDIPDIVRVTSHVDSQNCILV